MTDSQIAREIGYKPSGIAAQRQRLAEKFDIRTPEQLTAVANELAHHPAWKASDRARRAKGRKSRGPTSASSS
jgi:hypothetical protein